MKQEFNSLDPQRKRIPPSIRSQARKGWTVPAHLYDVGKFASGTMNDEALKPFLTDIKGSRHTCQKPHTVARFSRSLLNSLRMRESSQRSGVLCLSPSQQMIAANTAGQVLGLCFCTSGTSLPNDIGTP